MQALPLGVGVAQDICFSFFVVLKAYTCVLVDGGKLRVWGGAWGPGRGLGPGANLFCLRKMGASVFAVHPWMLSQDKQPSSRLQIIRDLELRAGEHLPNPKSV